MNEANEQPEKESVETEATGTDTHTTKTSLTTDKGNRRRRVLLIVACVVMVAVAGTALVLWRQRENSGAGRPVPAPRMIAVDQPGNASVSSATNSSSNEPTISIPVEQIKRAGIKIEPVGEQLSSEGTGGSVATGVVQPNAYRESPVVSLVGGIVRHVNAELGQTVSRGQTMAVVFSDELASVQAKFVTAMAELDEHHKHHARTAKLVEIGAASREEFEQATTKLKTAESEVASLRQRLLLLGLTPGRVNELRSSSQVNSEVAIPAPASGTVTSRTVNTGEVIQANKEIMRVTDLSSVWVVGQVYEKDLGRIRVGSGASITSDAYPGKVFRGRISYVDPRLDPQTRTAQVRIELANPNQALKIGMYVNIAFATIGGAENVMATIPVSAVQNLNNQQVVFVATNEPNVFIMRVVRLGAETNGRVPVFEGLTVGDRIVTEGSFLLRAEWLKTHPSQ